MSGFGVEFGLEGLLEFTGQQLLFVRPFKSAPQGA
jgi:hypothetical protein